MAVVADFFGTGSFTHSADNRNQQSVAGFVRFHNGAPHRDRTGVSRRRTPSALPAKLTARALRGADEFLVSTTATADLGAPGAYAGGRD